MPRQSETGNVKKRCACGRPKWAACAHPWYIDYKAPKTERRRAGQRYRVCLDVAIGFHPENLAQATLSILSDESCRTAIKARLDQIIASLGGPGGSARAACASCRS